MKSRRALFITFLLLSMIYDCVAQSVIRGPYLQLGTPNSMIVRWRTDTPTDSRIWYGSSPTSLTSMLTVAGSRTEHEINVTSLTPDTKYYYAVGDNSGTLSYDNLGFFPSQLAGEDNQHYFTTSPPHGTNKATSIWVLGDAGTNDANQRAVREGFYSHNGGPHSDLILTLGDNAYEDGTDAEYQLAWFEDMYEQSLINSVLWNCPGNHDINSANSLLETGPYYDIFNLPRNGEAGGVPSGTEAYYSFDYANIHFISINTEDIDQSPGSPMLTWLQNDISSTTQEWIIAFTHHQAYYSTAEVRANIVPILEAGGVDLVLYGHKHLYRRSYLMDGHYGPEGSFDPVTMALDIGDGRIDGNGGYMKPPGVVANSGTVHLISGSAGKVSPLDAGYPFFIYEYGQPDAGSVNISISGTQMDVQFINYQGNVLDYFTILKGQGIAPSVSVTNPADGTSYPNVQPITVDADASDPDGQVTQVEFFANGNSIGVDMTEPYSISWTPATEGVYEIYARATDSDNNTVQSPSIMIQVGIFSRCSVVSVGSDDGEETISSGSMSLGSADLEF
ncbi:MAG: Ig-like domain-containing protein, partial [Saprospiraceae bacterium]|nr:Ig-like domain-containing protein [Saprospiraceae bacterium]